MDLSVVIPVYNEVESVDELCRRLHEVLPTLGKTYEAVLVDDGSSDGTWDRMVELSKKYPCLTLVRFRRNYGQTAAMAAGIDQAAGEIIVMLDADLQNPPEEIPKVLSKMTDDVDVVSGWRKDRQDKFLSRRLPSMIANGIISRITGVKLHDYGCSLKAYRAEVLKRVNLYGEMHRFIPALADWEGSNLVEVEVDHAARKYGEAKYGIDRTFRVVLDLMTVKFLLQHSRGPIQIFGKIGGWFLIPGVLIFIAMVLLNLVGSIMGYTDRIFLLIKGPSWLITTFMLMFFGTQFILQGLLAELQTRTYFESQNKRPYNVRDVVQSPASDTDAS